MSIRIQNIDGAGGFLDVDVLDKSYRHRQIMGDDDLTLYLSHTGYLSIAIGAYVDFEGARYYLRQPDNFKKHHSRNYDYTIVLEGEVSGLVKYKMRDNAEKLLKFPLTAKPQQHLQLLIDNLNERESGWTVGTCVDAAEKLISYNHTNLREALQLIAEAFDTEWEVSGKTIHLKRLEYNKVTPLALSYGKGNGFKSGLGRTNTDDKGAIEVLHIQGGNRNIDRSKYGNGDLLLPKSKTYTYEGREYITSADGRSIQRNDKAIATGIEDSLDCTHIYPSRVGSVSEVVVVDADRHLYNFKDASIPEDLDYSKCVLEGETMTVIFQDGLLAGREFEIDSYVHSERLFRLVPQEEEGLTLPDATFQPRVDEQYAIFGIQLPDAYIQDDATETGAAYDMLKEAVKYLYENEDPRFTFSGELDGIWAKKDWLNIGGKIKLGGYVNFSDTQFQPSGVLIRIVGIKDYVNNPHSPELELSNVTVGGSVISELNKIKENEVVGDELHRQSISFTKRRFRSAQETIEMLTEAVDGFGKGINPLSVQSMSLLVGDESLQFRFVDSKTNPTEVIHNITFDNSTKVLSADGGWMQHMTVGITVLTTQGHTYKFWDVEPFNSPALVDGTKPYYFYIKASKTAETAVFVLSETAIKMESVSGYYHFLVGFLNSEVADERTFAQMYGFTEVLPGRISTSKIHADTVEATEVLAQQIYASGAQIGGVDIDPADIGANGITGLRLGNLTTFNPASGKEGIMLGKQAGKYKAFIGNATQNIVFDGANLLLSGFPMLGTGEAIGVGELSQYFEIVNKGQANAYLRAKVALASVSEIMAYAENSSLIPSLWDSMPIASADKLGGVKVSAGLTIDANGLLSVDGELGGVSSWNDLTDKPTWLAPTTQAAFEAAHDHSKLNGYAATDYLRKGESTAISGLYTFNVTTGNVPFLVPSSKTGRVINLNADLLDGYHASDLALSGHTHSYINNYLAVNKNSAASEALDVNGNIKGNKLITHTSNSGWRTSSTSSSSGNNHYKIAAFDMSGQYQRSGLTCEVLTRHGEALRCDVMVERGSTYITARNFDVTGNYNGKTNFKLIRTSDNHIELWVQNTQAYDTSQVTVRNIHFSTYCTIYDSSGVTSLPSGYTYTPDMVHIGDGNITAEGEVTAYSDIRLKSNFKTIRNPLARISQLWGCTYDKDGRRSAGLIAQHVQRVLPEAVHTGAYLSINNAGVTGLLVEGIKAVNRNTESNTQRIVRLEKENKQLLTKIQKQNETIELLAANAGGLDSMRKGA